LWKVIKRSIFGVVKRNIFGVLYDTMDQNDREPVTGGSDNNPTVEQNLKECLLSYRRIPIRHYSLQRELWVLTQPHSMQLKLYLEISKQTMPKTKGEVPYFIHWSGFCVQRNEKIKYKVY
jgi:hypothetical protein